MPQLPVHQLNLLNSLTNPPFLPPPPQLCVQLPINILQLPPNSYPIPINPQNLLPSPINQYPIPNEMILMQAMLKQTQALPSENGFLFLPPNSIQLQQQTLPSAPLQQVKPPTSVQLNYPSLLDRQNQLLSIPQNSINVPFGPPQVSNVPILLDPLKIQNPFLQNPCLPTTNINNYNLKLNNQMLFSQMNPPNPPQLVNNIIKPVPYPPGISNTMQAVQPLQNPPAPSHPVLEHYPFLADALKINENGEYNFKTNPPNPSVSKVQEELKVKTPENEYEDKPPILKPFDEDDDIIIIDSPIDTISNRSASFSTSISSPSTSYSNSLAGSVERELNQSRVYRRPRQLILTEENEKINLNDYPEFFDYISPNKNDKTRLRREASILRMVRESETVAQVEMVKEYLSVGCRLVQTLHYKDPQIKIILRSKLKCIYNPFVDSTKHPWTAGSVPRESDLFKRYYIVINEGQSYRGNLKNDPNYDILEFRRIRRILLQMHVEQSALGYIETAEAAQRRVNENLRMVQNM